MGNEDVVLTIREAAKYLKLNQKTIRRMIEEKRLVAYRIGHSWRIRNDDLRSLVSKNGGQGMKIIKTGKVVITEDKVLVEDFTFDAENERELVFEQAREAALRWALACLKEAMWKAMWKEGMRHL